MPRAELIRENVHGDRVSGGAGLNRRPPPPLRSKFQDLYLVYRNAVCCKFYLFIFTSTGITVPTLRIKKLKTDILGAILSTQSELHGDPKSESDKLASSVEESEVTALRDTLTDYYRLTRQRGMSGKGVCFKLFINCDF